MILRDPPIRSKAPNYWAQCVYTGGQVDNMVVCVASHNGVDIEPVVSAVDAALRGEPAGAGLEASAPDVSEWPGAERPIRWIVSVGQVLIGVARKSSQDASEIIAALSLPLGVGQEQQEAA